jgi:hydroxymethylbilane synthase
MSARTAIRIGTRASALARWQAQWVAKALAGAGHATTLVPITTRGDAQQIAPVEQLGTRGVFTKELQRALLADEIDVAVHSLKDLPTEPVDGLMLAAVPERESPWDVLVCRESASLEALPRGARLGTGSLRRQSQLLHLRPDLNISPIRGNVDTRLRKLDEGEFDALVLAEAGLRRLGIEARATQILGAEQMLPAIGQGALGLEIRVADDSTKSAVTALNHWPSHVAVLAERTFLDALDGGCLAPIGAIATIASDGPEMRLEGVVLSRDGKSRLRASIAGTFSTSVDSKSADALDHAKELGRRLATELLARGAADLIRAARFG